ncbi:Probable polygalacturonase At3g15720, partial [Linum perenne]
INGGGQIDGQGHIWWDRCQSFHGCNNLHLNSIHHVNSQRNHISLNACKAVEISHVRIMAPEYSPNTDGIDISASSHLNIHDSVIGTGDDCIAINGFSSNINISRVMCGPGHGISIGSLGKNRAYETVEDVRIRDCTFTDTMCKNQDTARQGGRGFVRRISFEDITLVNADNPIVIEQAYTGQRASPREDISSGDHVEISEVTYRGVVRTSSDEWAVYFNCSGGSGCKDIVMDNVEIKSAVEGKQLFAVCNNAHGSSRADLSPKVSCLMP